MKHVFLIRYIEKGQRCWDNQEARTAEEAVQLLREIDPESPIEVLSVEQFDNYEDAIARAYAGDAAQESQAAPAVVELVEVESLREGLDLGDYGEYLNDYRNSSAYISDAIMEIADNNVGIYYSQLLKFVSENPEALSDVIDEGLYDPRHNYNFWDHARSAEFLVIERDIYNHLEDALMVAALDFIRYDLGREFIPEELAEYLQTWVTDPGDRMSDIPERIAEFLEDYPC